MATPRAFDWTNGHVQRETGTDSVHIERELVLMCGRASNDRGVVAQEFRIRYQIPRAIHEAVDSGMQERIRLACQDLFERMMVIALFANEPNALKICLDETVRTYLDNVYRAFAARQFLVGNKKWLVPATIQDRVLEEN